MASEEDETWLYNGVSVTVRILIWLSKVLAEETKLLGELNDLRLRTWRFREARVLGVRNPSQLPRCIIKKNIWEENFKNWFEDEKKELNEQLTYLQLYKNDFIRRLSGLREIEVSNDIDLEVIIYLKRQQIVPWNGSAKLPSSLSVELRQEFVSELVSNGIPVIRVSDE